MKRRRKGKMHEKKREEEDNMKVNLLMKQRSK
jgi:hypothetical protein